MSGLKRGLLAMYDCVSECVLTVDSGIMTKSHGKGSKQPQLWPASEVVDGGVRKRKKTPRYSIRVEYSSNRDGGSKLSRSESLMTDEGGFDLKLPPNRFRTRSVAIVAGYCPERLYSNMPPGAFVVESGVYKVGADRDYVKSEPIYWKQVVYGTGSEGSGTYPRNLATRDRETHQILHEPRLIPGSNLELRQDPSGARIRASSPLDQDRPIMEFLSPRGNQSDISSVPHPSSADRSIPSTLLTNPQSSISSPNFSLEQTQSSSRTRSSRFPSLRTIPEDSKVSIQADIHASDYSNLAEYSTGASTQPQQATPVSSRGQLSRAQQQALAELYRQQDISYLGHYPYVVPVHRAISPSKQYPPPPYQSQQAQHIQPPRIPDIGVRGVDPREVDIYQRIAQIDPESGTETNQRPLATSSPPHKRKLEDADQGPRSVQKPRFPTPPGPGPGPPPPGTRRTASPSHTRVVTFDTLNLSQSRQAGPQTATAPAKKTSRSGVLRHRDRRMEKTQSDGEGDTDTGVTDFRQKRTDVDSVSVVSEGLDAEVTAITSSSSPGSSGSNTLQPIIKSQTLINPSDIDRSSSSGIASKNTSQNQTSSSHSTSAGSASLHHSSLSPENISSVIISDKFSKKSPSTALTSKLQKIEDSMQQVLYENWPPRPHQYVPNTQQFYAYNVTAQPTISSGVPPFTPHSPAGAIAMYPVQTRSGQGISSPDTSTESPVSRSSRPNSSQSAPLDRSVDRHYEWDRATADDSSLPSLPPEWAIRRSPAYNPRRDRDIGQMVSASTRERVFSDSEIYSNVFPRRRLQLDVEARVRAMKKEFKEFRKTQNVSPNDSDRLESLI